MVDSGATHNFLAQSLVAELGAEVATAPMMVVTLADGTEYKTETSTIIKLAVVAKKEGEVCEA